MCIHKYRPVDVCIYIYTHVTICILDNIDGKIGGSTNPARFELFMAPFFFALFRISGLGASASQGYGRPGVSHGSMHPEKKQALDSSCTTSRQQCSTTISKCANNLQQCYNNFKTLLATVRIHVPVQDEQPSRTDLAPEGNKTKHWLPA